MMTLLKIPNILTLGRLLLTIGFFAAGLQNDWYWALGLFAAAGITDLIDGTVARLLKQQSRFGAFVDPMADKLMMLAGITLLTMKAVFPWWLMALIVGRDLYIVLGLFYLWSRDSSINLRPSWSSKLTTFFQIILLTLGFLSLAVAQGVTALTPLSGLLRLLPFCLWGCVALILISGWQYTQLGLKFLQKSKN